MNYFNFPLESWTNDFVYDWLIPVLGDYFDKISMFVIFFIDGVSNLLLFIPAELMALILVILSWRAAGKRVAIFTIIGTLYIGSVNLWEEAMLTLAVVVVATLFSIIIGIPLGILMARSKIMEHIVRPVLDFMQTLPSFVYLIPAILLFGLGKVPAVIATFVFATPPAVRMTSLAIKQVPREMVEAAQAFGSTPWQMLLKVQLPVAAPTIMAGVNQTIMLALSMAVISSMIGAPGLGSTVLAGISRVNVGLGLVGGLGIVVLAIILDRVTQSIGGKK